MQNLDEKIDLILETSLDEAPARIGTISARDLLSKNFSEPLDDETASRTGFRSLSSYLRRGDIIPELESGERDSFLSSLESDLVTHFASEETTSEATEPKNYKPINVRKTIETIKKVKNDEARKSLRKELSDFLRKNELTPDNSEDKIYLSSLDTVTNDEVPNDEENENELLRINTLLASHGQALDHPKEWNKWYVGYVVLDKSKKMVKSVEVGGPFSYEEAADKIEDIVEDPEQDQFAQTYVPFVSLQNKKGTYKRPKLHPLWRKGTKGVQRESLLREDKLGEITINFSELRKRQINESFLAMFGGWVEHILKSMFGGGYSTLPVQVVGTKRELESFTATIGSEKRYIESARRHGLDHPTTYKNKAKLDVAVKNFERDTGLKWPFK